MGGVAPLQPHTSDTQSLSRAHAAQLSAAAHVRGYALLGRHTDGGAPPLHPHTIDWHSPSERHWAQLAVRAVTSCDVLGGALLLRPVSPLLGGDAEDAASDAACDDDDANAGAAEEGGAREVGTQADVASDDGRDDHAGPLLEAGPLRFGGEWLLDAPCVDPGDVDDVLADGAIPATHTPSAQCWLRPQSNVLLQRSTHTPPRQVCCLVHSLPPHRPFWDGRQPDATATTQLCTSTGRIVERHAMNPTVPHETNKGLERLATDAPGIAEGIPDVLPSRGMAAEPTISGRAILKLLDLGPDIGVSAQEAYADAGIDPTAYADTRIPLSRLHSLWEAVLRRVPRADLALVGAQHYSPGDYGLVGFVCMNSATLGEGLRHVVRYSRLWTDEPIMELAPDGSLSLTWRTPFPDGPGLHMTAEATFAEVLNGARLLTQQQLAPREAHFRHAGPKDTSVHRTFFGAPVVFGAAAYELLFSREQLAIALPRADPQLGQYLRTLANDALAKRGDVDSVQEKLRALLAEELQKGVPALRPLAKRMGLGERTLRRRLEESGTTFRELLDQTRSELARGYISDRRIPLAEVAFLLGFSEPSTFHRAFRLWNDMTPSAWRQRHVPGV